LSKPLAYFGLLFFLLFSTVFFVSPVLADQAGAQAAISQAQSNLLNCYKLADQAEAAGANVTSLTDSFNNASNLLSQAQLAYASGDYDAASSYASQSQSSLSGFSTQATALKDSAENNASQSLLVAILSAIISIVVLCGGIGAYVVLNRKEKVSHGNSV
jgi:cellobiose-specific phosphotransferase system component IIC